MKKFLLKDVGTVITGRTPSRNRPDYWGSDLAFITPSDFTDSKYVKPSRFLSAQGSDSMSKVICPQTSVIVTCIGSDMGKVALCKTKFVSNQQINSVVIDQSMASVDYVYYLLKASYRRLRLYAETGGSTMPIINKTTFENLEFEMPCLYKQKKIADILGTLDEKIELNRCMNETLEQIGQTLFRHYFIDNPDSVSWDIIKVGDVLSDLQSGSRPKGGALEEGVPSIGAENINGLGKYDYSKEKFISSEFFNNLKRGVVKNEDVLLYKDGAYVGKKALFMDDFPHKKCAINEHVFILRTNKRINSQFYLYFWLDQSSITKKIVDSGVKAAQPGINQSNVNNLPILLPPERLVSEFDDAIKPLMKRIFANAIENNKLASIRDSLLPKIISGEIDV